MSTLPSNLSTKIGELAVKAAPAAYEMAKAVANHVPKAAEQIMQKVLTVNINITNINNIFCVVRKFKDCIPQMVMMKNTGYTVEEIAKHFGCSVSYVYHLLRNYR